MIRNVYKLMVFALLLVLLFLTGCASMANQYLTSIYDEPTDIATSTEAINYLFANICPYIDADTAEEITGLLKKSMEYQRLYAYRVGDSVVLINFVSNLKAEITKNGISFGLSVDLTNYTGNDRIKKLILKVDDEEIGSAQVGKDEITISTKYSDTSHSYLSYGHHDRMLPDSWSTALCSLCDGKRHNVYFVWEASDDAKWYLELMPPNGLNDTLLQATYLIDKAMKSYSEIISQLKSSGIITGSYGKALLTAIENGHILARKIPDGFSLCGDNIILEKVINSWQLFIVVESLSSSPVNVAIYADNFPIWVPDSLKFVSGSSFVYPLDNSILPYFQNSKKYDIDFYDSNLSLIDSKSIITSNDKLLVDAFFRQTI